MAKRILMVMTSHDILGDTGKPTGLWLEEFASPYYAFLDAGYTLTLASTLGGQVPVDPVSLTDDALTADTKRYAEDEAARSALSATIPLEDVKTDEFDAVFYPGGHGPLWDLSDNAHSKMLIESMLGAGKPVVAVCHAPIVLKDVNDSQGQPYIKGRAVTGFSNSEETAVDLIDVVPYLVEDELVKRGGEFTKKGDFEPYVVESGHLITGQNPASSRPAAQALMKRLEG
ncbi:type 1 glutamine amidotransferase domain-containing protein [Aestuariibacter sp. A3R04]|uniref:type 1 glutamine amidotransferase domain-containing protein n=1 Tax=Aestuariibacter sp. A3R04 TaxID=2841571 RepID=UPI001C0983A9|nr:type 1 glutamine amidotransferase domain-containing protein [Aestuariibacter sp. A3R04]MBU3021941.1 type 1 glutamine amidotransferase domain-containing protein [Aestuariibacter sp. A3R04]